MNSEWEASVESFLASVKVNGKWVEFAILEADTLEAAQQRFQRCVQQTGWQDDWKVEPYHPTRPLQPIDVIT